MTLPTLPGCFWAVALAAVLVTAGCGPSPGPATSASQPKPALSAKPLASAAAAQPPASGDWDQIVAAAKREGQLVLLTQGGGDIGSALSDEFKKRYPEISMDVTVTSASGGELAPKLLTERQAGMYRVDVVVLGTTTMLTGLVPAGAADPIQPFLAGPDVRDRSKWLGGAFDFADEAGKYDVIFLGGVKTPFIYNPSAASASEFKSYKDLLNPKWKSKIAMIDPRGPGSGLASATFFYKTASLGKDFLKQLFTQNVTLTKDDRQLTDWAARGQYPIALASSDFSAVTLKNSGVAIGVLPGEALQEGTYLTASGGSVGVINRAPHPNATKVYLNWLLSKEGQEAASKAYGYPSRRLDASTAGLPDYLIPKPGVQYDNSAKESYVRLRDEVVGYLKTVIPE